METFLFLTAPIIYFAIIIFSIWLGWSSGTRRRPDIKPIMAILAGLVICPLVGVLIQLGKLDITAPKISFQLTCISIGIGFLLGVGYIWLAKIVVNDSLATSLFIFGSVAGSSISLYFYFFNSQVQDILIGVAWGFLFGVLFYSMLFVGKEGGIQTAFGDLLNPSRRTRY